MSLPLNPPRLSLFLIGALLIACADDEATTTASTASGGQAGSAQAGASAAGNSAAGKAGQASGSGGSAGKAGAAGEGGGGAAGSGAGGAGAGGAGAAGAGGAGAGGAGAGGAGAGGDAGGGAGAGSGGAGAGGGAGSGGDDELEAMIANCLRVNACEAGGGTPLGLQACLGHLLDRPWLWASTGPTRMFIETMDCKLAAKDCAGVLACSPSLEPHAAKCAEHPGNGLCEGDTWVFCDDLGAPLSALDCGAAGLACGVDVWAGCGLVPCKFGETGPSCDPADPAVLLECSPAGFLVRVDCRTQYNYVNVSGKGSEEIYSIAGEVCGFDVQRGAIACIGTGDPCEFFSQKCDGDVLETCAGGKITRRDCAALKPAGQGCGIHQSGPFAGAASCGLINEACGLGDDETCKDGVISFCRWDKPATLDCVARGYSGCATATQGERKVAYCTP